MPTPLKCGSQQLVAHECAIGHEYADYICLVRRRRILYSHTAPPTDKLTCANPGRIAPEFSGRSVPAQCGDAQPRSKRGALNYNTLRLCSGAVICISCI